MATTQAVSFIEASINYYFTRTDLLPLALTSAGATKENHDGNRKLANMGTALIHFLMFYIGFKADTSRSKN